MKTKALSTFLIIFQCVALMYVVFTAPEYDAYLKETRRALDDPRFKEVWSANLGMKENLTERLDGLIYSHEDLTMLTLFWAVTNVIVISVIRVSVKKKES
jgi:hypothetical protein